MLARNIPRSGSNHRLVAMNSTLVYVMMILLSTNLSVRAFVVSTPPMTKTAKTHARITQVRLDASSNAQQKDTKNDDGELATEKYGLEVGLFQSLKQKDGGETAKSLLKKYGIAYLATSIPLALISFILCYYLVDNGIDVGALLEKVGIATNTASSSSGEGDVDLASTAGTFAIAYAAHKAASPIRFPPTVILTPVVARLIGKEPVEVAEEEA